MISFKQFLLEDEQDPIDLIRRDCKPFLNIWDQYGLFRGMNLKSEEKVIGTIKNQHAAAYKNFEVYKRKVRKDRKPLSTSDKRHVEANKWFEDNFGVKARSEGLFCYPKGLWQNASEYGKMYLIFPIGEFKIIWSPEVKDLFMQIDFGKEIRRKNIDELLGSLEFQDNDVKAALKSSSELMVICDEYYVVEANAYEQIKNDL